MLSATMPADALSYQLRNDLAITVPRQFAAA